MNTISGDRSASTSGTTTRSGCTRSFGMPRQVEQQNLGLRRRLASLANLGSEASTTATTGKSLPDQSESARNLARQGRRMNIEDGQRASSGDSGVPVCMLDVNPLIFLV